MGLSFEVFLLLLQTTAVSCDFLSDVGRYPINKFKHSELQREEVSLDGRDSESYGVKAMRTICELETKVPLQLPDDVGRFRDEMADFVDFWNECSRLCFAKSTSANFNYETNLTEENKKKVSEVSTEASALQRALTGKTNQIMAHALYHDLDPDLQRQIRFLGFSTSPKDPKDARASEENRSSMQQIYSTARVNNMTLDPDLTNILVTSHDPDVLLEVWLDWRQATGSAIRDKYVENVRLLNLGARQNGFSDFAEAWMEEQFEATDYLEEMAEQFWREIEPLYEEVHAYVRYRLAHFYSDYKPAHDSFSFTEIIKEGAIPAHLLGNMWGQMWDQIYDIVKPYPDVEEDDYDAVMVQQNYDVDKMFKMAEDFYTSIGLFPMSDTFNKKSMKTRPPDREVVCHASASDMFSVKPVKDFRIKMCTNINMEDFRTVHHEMGHIEYYMAYQDQPTVYRNSPNSAFHEALGDTIALSFVSRKHLRTIGLDETPEVTTSGNLDNESNVSKRDINFLMLNALVKIVFLPFGLMVDKWRFDVFRGRVTEHNYNKHWWDLRLKYQGLVAPIARSEEDFDPAAKFHVPSNSPYICYFIGHIAQFQFYKSMCDISGHQGPLYNCDFYGSKDAGANLLSMMSLGKSKHWTEAMSVLTGTGRLSTAAILEYFKPLHDWLKQENKRLHNDVGWENASINWKD